MCDLGSLLDDWVRSRDPDCTGLVYRAYHSEYSRDSGYGIREGFRLLKRKSCKCGTCLVVLSNFGEDAQEGVGIEVEPPGIRDGRMYKLVLVEGEPDWETGIVEDWSYKFVLMEREER